MSLHAYHQPFSKSGRKFTILRQVQLFNKSWTFSKLVYSGRSVMEFDSRQAAEAWVADHPFTSDPHDVIKSIKYKIGTTYLETDKSI